MKALLNKKYWKILLAAGGGIIVVFTIIYLNFLATQIEDSEKSRLMAWQKAIINRASLVRATSDLFARLRIEEFKKIQLWADATRRVLETENNDDRSFYLSVISSNKTIPVILTDEKNKISSWANIDSVSSRNIQEAKPAEIAVVRRRFESIRALHEPLILPYYKNLYNKLYYDNSTIYYNLKSLIEFYESSFIEDIAKNTLSVPVIAIDSARDSILFIGNIQNPPQSSAELKKIASEMDLLNTPIQLNLGIKQITLHYRNSEIIKKIKYFPLIQLALIAIYILIAYYLFSISRTAQQNLIWLGMAKETAHQLGTPLSSLMGWSEILREKGLVYESDEIEKDINRLNIITDRFSKIGSTPSLTSLPLNQLLSPAIAYMRNRIPSGIEISVQIDHSINVFANQALFDWVIENMIKNAVDAMPGGKGKINFSVIELKKSLQIWITDSGKGISKKSQHQIFETGFTTKPRGWGLGLSLTKRIVEQYHRGRVFLMSSEPGKTIFIIEINKA